MPQETYIRVKVTDGVTPQSQIMTETYFIKVWLKTNNIWNRVVKDGVTISFTKVKKSALLTNKN